MAGKINSNRKGKNYEREISRRFRILYPKAKRGNQDNMVNTEADVEGTPFRIECKDHAKIGAFRFWDQATEERATHGDLERPICVVMKEKGKPSLAAIDLDLFLAILGVNEMKGYPIPYLWEQAEGLKEARKEARKRAKRAAEVKPEVWPS